MPQLWRRQTPRLDLDQMRQDMDSHNTTAIIERTRVGAAALNLKGTPALVIGETVIPGAISIEELQMLSLLNVQNKASLFA